jgi:hypothetical protein
MCTFAKDVVLQQSATSSSLVVDAIAVWQHDETGTRDIWYSVWDDANGQWWTPSGVEASPLAELVGDDFDPAIAFDRKGNAIAVWSHETDNPSLGYDIWYSKWSGNSWTSPMEVAPLVGNDTDPAVAFDTDGWGIAIWVHNGTFIYYSLWNGTDWIGPAQTIVPDWPAWPFWGSNMPEIVFTSSRARGYTSHQAVAIWTLWVIYPEVPPLLISRIYYAIWDGASWSPSPAEEIPGQAYNAASDGTPAFFRNGISSDNLNNAIAVWATDNITHPVYYAIWDGRAWGDATALDTQKAYGYMPAIAFSADNNATLTFTQNTTNIGHSRYVGGVWQRAAEAADSGGDDTRPAVAFLTSSRAVAVWSSDLLEPSEIFYSIWEPATETWITAASIVPFGLSGSDSNPSVASTSGSPTMPPTGVAPEIHDVAVVDVTPSETVVEQGTLVSVNVTVKNEGTTAETFDVTAYYNTTIIATQTVDNLASGSQKTLDFVWNTTDVTLGNYTLWAQASTVPGEVDTEDNTFINGVIEVTIFYTLAITTTTGGTTDPPPGNYSYKTGTTVTVTAIAYENYTFDHWELDSVNIGASNPVDVTMDANHSLHAVFAPLIHDVAITSLVVSPDSVELGQLVYINVTVENQGNYTETFTVSVYYARLLDPLIGSQNITLSAGDDTTLTFEWTPNITGRYEILANTTTIPGEIDTEDNTQTTILYVRNNYTQAGSNPNSSLLNLIGFIAGVFSVILIIPKLSKKKQTPNDLRNISPPKAPPVTEKTILLEQVKRCLV